MVQSMPDASPPSGTSRTRPGSSRRSCSRRARPATRRSIRAYAYLFNSYYKAVGAAASRAPRAACCRGRPSTRCTPTARTSTRAMAELLATSGAGVAALRRARAAPRAAASGAHAHRRQARVLRATRCGPRLSRDAPLTSPAARARRSTLASRSTRRRRARSATTATASPSTTSARATARSCRPFRSRRASSPAASTLAFIADGGYTRPELWLSDGWATRAARGLARRRSTGSDDGEAAGRASRSRAARRSIADEPVVPRELLRGRRVRALGRRAPADRGRVGARRARTRPSTATSSSRRRSHPRAAQRCGLRSCSATSGSGRRAPTRPIRGYRPARRRARRIQRQVHVQPDGAARRLVRRRRRATCARPTATSSRRTRAGNSRAFVSPRTHED